MSGAVVQWMEIALPVAAAQADEVAAQLALAVDAAQNGVLVSDSEVVFWVDQAHAENAAQQARTFAARARSLGLLLENDVVLRAAQPEEEWRDAWKRYFKTTRITRQLVIVPSWDTFSPSGDDLVLDLDPGQAFGTGDHASTKLILQALQGLRDDGTSPARILDLGTGSGILAIAAAKLWPSSTGLAIDNDPAAAACAAENLERNGVSERFPASATDLADVGERFQLVLANIQADVLTLLAPEIVRVLDHGGHLVLSGLLTEQIDSIRQVYEEHGLRTSWRQADSGDPRWSALLLTRP